MLGRRILLILVLLLIGGSFHLLVAAAGIPRFSAPLGVEECESVEYCLRRYDPAFSAPFVLGTAAAIHLGNTKSCVAGYGGSDPGSVYQFCIPSWVAFTDHGTFSGEAAREHAARSPGTAISGFTRLLHRRLWDVVVQKEMELVPYNFTTQLGWTSIQLATGHDKVFSPHYLASILISELKQMAEAHLGRQIKNAVITVPRHVTYDGRQAVSFAGTEYGGFRVAKVVDEQIADAAAHGLHTKWGHGKVVLVFHVGGRTSHATIFKFNGRPRLIQARDDLFLGGDDFTARVVDHFVELIKQQRGSDVRHDKMALLRLREECERAKKALSDQDETLVQVDSLVDGVDFSAPLTRAKLEELNQDLFYRAVGLVDLVVMNAPVVEKRKDMVHAVLDRAMAMVNRVVMGRSRRLEESRKDMVHEIILVGGSSRIPKMQQLVKDYFNGREPSRGVEPDEAVINGALFLTRPGAAWYLESCFRHWHGGDPGFL